MTQDQQQAAVVAAAQAPFRALCREMLGTLRARGVPPVPVVAVRRPPLGRQLRAVPVDVAWPLRTLHPRQPALFADGSLRPAEIRGAPDGDGITTVADAPPGARVRWEHAVVGTSPGSPYLCDPREALVPATAVPAQFVGMPIPGGPGADLGVADPSGQLLYPTVQPHADGEEVWWWPLAAELAGAVARLAEEFGADPWPDPRAR
jgi:hypothetical protein